MSNALFRCFCLHLQLNSRYHALILVWEVNSQQLQLSDNGPLALQRLPHCHEHRVGHVASTLPEVVRAKILGDVAYNVAGN